MEQQEYKEVVLGDLSQIPTAEAAPWILDIQNASVACILACAGMEAWKPQVEEEEDKKVILGTSPQMRDYLSHIFKV